MFRGESQALPEVINLSLSTVGLIGRAKTLVIDGAQAHKMFYKILKKKLILFNVMIKVA